MRLKRTRDSGERTVIGLSGALQITLEEFEKRFRSTKASNVFAHTTSEEFKNETIANHLGFVFKQNSATKVT